MKVIKSLNIIVVLFSISVHADQQRDDIVLGAGTELVQTQELDFGFTREKRFCDGKESGWLKSLVSSSCCTIRINSLNISDNKELVLSAKKRSIKYSDYVYGMYIAISAGSLTTISCSHGNHIKLSDIESSFGDLFTVQNIVIDEENSPELIKINFMNEAKELPRVIEL